MRPEMRFHFQERPWDLCLAIGYTLVVSATVLAVGAGGLWAILLVLFVPGYVTVAALFPGRKEIDWIERFALSLGIGLAIIPAISLALNFTPLGIRFAPIVIALAVFSTLVGLSAWHLRVNLPIEERLSANLNLPALPWKGYNLVERVLAVGLVTAITAAVATFGYVLTAPRPYDQFTEFYMLGPDGNVSGYPTRLNVSQPGMIFIGITNREGSDMNYSIQVDRVGVVSLYNATTGSNETIEVNRTAWPQLNVTVGNGQSWIQPYTFSISKEGSWEVQFLLYKNGLLTEQQLRLFVRVTKS